MSAIRFLNQPFSGQLGESLKDALKNEEYEMLDIAVAFAKNSGVLRLKEAIESYRSGGSFIRVVVGIDLGGTSYEALTNLFNLVDELYVVHVESDQTFHPKIYKFSDKKTSKIFIGSHNLTGGGLWTNIESSAVIELEASNIEDFKTAQQVDDYFSLLLHSAGGIAIRIETQDDIETLLAHGYIEKEMATKLRTANTKRARVKESARKTLSVNEPLFSKAVSAPLPKINIEYNSDVLEKSEKNFGAVSYGALPETSAAFALPSLTTEEGYQSFWFESRRLTGGSGNQLDLSMRAVIEKGNPTGSEYDSGDPGYMLGGVQFFGINPENPDERASLTINYDGVDYEGNTIIFPKGDKANGTWRLRINGVSKEGAIIHQVVDPDYFKNKILVFTRIEKDYYFLTVFEADVLQEFIDASVLVAHNGSNIRAKYIGLL